MLRSRDRLWLFVAALVGLTACGPDAEIEMRVCGDLKAPEQIDALRLSILDDEMNELRAGLVELVPREAPTSRKESGEKDDEGDRSADGESADGGEPESPKVRSLPVTGSLPGATGSGYLRVQGLLQGVEVARFDRRVYDLESLEQADMVLKNNCYGRLSCPLGQTCVAKLCQVAPTPSEPPGCSE
jgi:hypothetical protein